MAEPARSFQAPSEVEKKRLLDRLARVEGQLRGVQRMIGEEQECEVIVQQLAAARGALNKAFVELIACALEQRLAGGRSRSASDNDLHREVADVVGLLTKYS